MEYFFIRIFRSSASDTVDETADILDGINLLVGSQLSEKKLVLMCSNQGSNSETMNRIMLYLEPLITAAAAVPTSASSAARILLLLLLPIRRSEIVLEK